MTTDKQIKAWILEWKNRHQETHLSDHIELDNDETVEIEDLATFVCQKSAEAAYKEGYLVGRDEAEQQLETGFEGTLFQAEEKARAEGYKQGVEAERKKGRR